jgi:hypothetical protein
MEREEGGTCLRQARARRGQQRRSTRRHPIPPGWRHLRTWSSLPLERSKQRRVPHIAQPSWPQGRTGSWAMMSRSKMGGGTAGRRQGRGESSQEGDRE